jgi:hypothetical protein
MRSATDPTLRAYADTAVQTEYEPGRRPVDAFAAAAGATELLAPWVRWQYGI